MLYALGRPVSFALLVVSFFLAVTLGGWVCSAASGGTGLRPRQHPGRFRVAVRQQTDPFACVAGAIAGFGWIRPLELPVRAGRGRLAAACLAGPAANLMVGAAALASFGAVEGVGIGVRGSLVLQAGAPGLSLRSQALLLFGLMNLYVGLLSLVPLPPLPGGRLLFGLVPRSGGWARARHYLVEQNLGTAALLVLMLVPLGGPVALLPAVLDGVTGPILRGPTGG